MVNTKNVKIPWNLKKIFIKLGEFNQIQQKILVEIEKELSLVIKKLPQSEKCAYFEKIF